MILVVAAVLEAAGFAALARLRRRVTGEGLPARLVGVSIAAVAALIVGTVVDVSGVALGVPVVAGMAFVIWRSPWRSGDVALFALVAAAGTAIGYFAAAALDPDTGSYGDQGALALALLAVVLVAVALVGASRRLRQVR